MWKRRTSSPASDIWGTVVVVLMQLLLLWFMGIDFNRAQELWQQTCMLLLSGGLTIYLLGCAWIYWRRRVPTRSDHWFIKYGVAIPLALELAGIFGS